MAVHVVVLQFGQTYCHHILSQGKIPGAGLLCFKGIAYERPVHPRVGIGVEGTGVQRRKFVLRAGFVPVHTEPVVGDGIEPPRTELAVDEGVDGSVAEPEVIFPTVFGEREIRVRIETCGRIDLHIALAAVGANLLSGGSQPTKCSGNN